METFESIFSPIRYIAVLAALGTGCQSVHALTNINCTGVRNADGINAAIQAEGPGGQVNLTGVCKENIVIDVDNFTLSRGVTRPTIISANIGTTPAIRVEAAKNVLLNGLTVRKSTPNIVIEGGSGVELVNVTSENSYQGAGLQIIGGSAATAINSIFRNNQGSGIIVFGFSNADFEIVEVSGNGNNGIDIGAHSYVKFDEVTATLPSTGGAAAVFVGDNSTLRIFDNSQITSDKLFGVGLWVRGDSFVEIENNNSITNSNVDPTPGIADALRLASSSSARIEPNMNQLVGNVSITQGSQADFQSLDLQGNMLIARQSMVNASGAGSDFTGDIQVDAMSLFTADGTSTDYPLAGNVTCGDSSSGVGGGGISAFTVSGPCQSF